jgi:hypothetical protein
MKRTLLAAIMVFVALAQTGCGDGGSSGPSTSFVQISSDSALDGTIAQTSPGVFTVTQGMTPTVQSVFVGVAPGTSVESRAFLDFPLASVPPIAVIASATLHIVINNIQPTTGVVPLVVDLVSFPSTLVGTDFDRTILLPLASISISPAISLADVNTDVQINVTDLMTSAQLQVPPLSNFQLRILGVGSTGLMEIDDTTGANRLAFAPLLDVTFF